MSRVRSSLRLPLHHCTKTNDAVEIVRRRTSHELSEAVRAAISAGIMRERDRNVLRYRLTTRPFRTLVDKKEEMCFSPEPATDRRRYATTEWG